MSSTRAAWPWWVGPLTVLSALLLSGVAASVVTGLVGQQFNGSYAHWAGLLQDAVWLAVAVAIPWLCVRRPTSADYGLRRPTPKRAVITVLVAVVVFAAFSAIYAALAGVGEEPNEKIALTGFGESTIRDVAFVLLYGAVAPLVEEVLFRGVLFGALRNATGPLPAALLTGGFFGLLHLGGGQDDLIPTLIAFGVVLALTYHYSASLYVAIAVHAANNALATGSQATFTHAWIGALLVLTPLLALGGAALLARALDRRTEHSAAAPAAGTIA